MSEGGSFKDEAARLGPQYLRNLEQLRQLGLIRRRRLRGDYTVTPEGAAYLNDLVRRDDEVRSWSSRHAEQWEAGEMTEVQREMARIELIFLGVSRDVSRETEAASELSDSGAALKAAGLEEGLLRDEDWERLDGEICRATAFSPFPDAEENWSIPYAAIELESPVLAGPTVGYITNRLDLDHLTEAFSLQADDGDKEVIVIWHKSKLNPAFGAAARGMPGLLVWVCPKDSYELMTDPSFRPELEAHERHDAARPLMRWEPEELV